MFITPEHTTSTHIKIVIKINIEGAKLSNYYILETPDRLAEHLASIPKVA